MSIGKAIAQDLQERFASGDFVDRVVDEAGDVHYDSIKRQSKQATSASGLPFEPLSQMYAREKQQVRGTDLPDLEYSGRAMDTLDYKSNNEGVNFYFGAEDIEEYMGDHQEGTNGMPQRKWFPDSEDNDDNTSVQQFNAEQVEQVLTEFLNEDRVIKVLS